MRRRSCVGLDTGFPSVAGEEPLPFVTPTVAQFTPLRVPAFSAMLVVLPLVLRDVLLDPLLMFVVLPCGRPVLWDVVWAMVFPLLGAPVPVWPTFVVLLLVLPCWYTTTLPLEPPWMFVVFPVEYPV